MAKNQAEKQNLPGEEKLFESKKHIKIGKTFVLESESITFPFSSEEICIDVMKQSGPMKTIGPVKVLHSNLKCT